MSEWIKCSERLPELYKYCLIIIRDPAIICIAKLCIGRKGNVWEGQYEIFGFSEVTHWRELPELSREVC